MKYIQTFLKKFNRISFRETPKVLTRAWEKIFEIQHAQPKDIHELLHKLLEDLQIINEELAGYINSLSCNRPAFYNDDDEYSIQYEEYLENSSNAIAPVLPTEEPDNSVSMGDELLSTISEIESDEVIKSIVESLVPIPSESEGISDDICDVPFCDNSPPLDVLTNHFELFFDFNDDYTSSDDDYFEDINYVEASTLDSELISLEEVQDDILREKLLNINLLIAKIESLNDNSTPDCVLKSPSLFPIPVRIVTLSLRSPILLSLIRIILYPNSRLLVIVQKRRVVAVPLLMLITLFPSMIHFSLRLNPIRDSDFSSSDDSLGSDLEIFETRNKIFDPGIFLEVQSKRFLSHDTFSPTYVSLIFEDRHYLSFTYVIRTFLPYFTYLVESPFLLSSGSEDIIFDPGISIFHFSSRADGI
nr:hypothetical protein [Tanacetum cinerariifolium]